MIEAIIFDYARTLVNPDVNPPQLYPGVEEMLKTLRGRGFKLALVSRGKEIDVRKKEIKDLELEEYFDVIEVVGQDATKDFRPLVERLKVEPTACVVFGDRIKSEILQGNLMGMTTVWLQEEGGKFASELPETSDEKPDYIINSRSKFIQVIDSIS